MISDSYRQVYSRVGLDTYLSEDSTLQVRRLFQQTFRYSLKSPDKHIYLGDAQMTSPLTHVPATTGCTFCDIFPLAYSGSASKYRRFDVSVALSAKATRVAERMCSAISLKLCRVNSMAISVGWPTVCMSNELSLIKKDNLPLKCCQFCRLGMIMQYTMAASEDRHQHLDDFGVGNRFEFRGYR